MTKAWAVYLHRAVDGRVLYIGSSSNVARRTAEHADRSAWWGQVVTVETLATFRTKRDALEYEHFMIGRLGAVHNVHGRHTEPQTDEQRATVASIARLLEPGAKRREKLLRSRAIEPVGAVPTAWRVA